MIEEIQKIEADEKLAEELKQKDNENWAEMHGARQNEEGEWEV